MTLFTKETEERLYFQDFSPEKDVLIEFGPCTESLFNLIGQGYWLEIFFSKFRYSRNVGRRPLKLTNGVQSWTLTKVRASGLERCADLSSLLSSTVTVNLDSITVETAQEYDPWQELKKKFPRKNKGLPMIGNTTGREYILQALKR